MITWGFPRAPNLSLSLWLSGWIAATVGIRKNKHRPGRLHDAVIC